MPDLLPADLSFLAMVGAFLLAQCAYVVAFLPFRSSSVLRRPGSCCRMPQRSSPSWSPVARVPGRCSSVVVYGAALVTMAALSTGVSRLTGIGGLVFLVSDALIAVPTSSRA